VGGFVGFLLLINVFYQPLEKIAAVIETYPKGIAGFRRYSEMLATLPDITDAPDAVKYRLAEAIADTKEELAAKMGLTEWVEVGIEADDYQQEFRENVATAQTRVNEFQTKYNIAVGMAGSAPTRDELERAVGTARRHLRAMKGLVDKAPSLVDFMGLDDEWFRAREEELRRMLDPDR
jgi:ABC-type multidrug transport system fused ATPase/permease subunit